jgi:outer membrane protein OmpA-like peptidoglycan-associated protein
VKLERVRDKRRSEDMRKTAFIGIVFILLGMSAWAGGQPEAPTIPPITSGTKYLSPNDDGVKDEATINFSVTIYVKSKEGYVPEYGLEIKDAQGNVLKRVVEKEKRDIGWLMSIFTGYKEFTLERSVTWDGRNNDGQKVPDGTYELSLWVLGAKEKRQEQSLDNFVVDTRPPEALIVEPESLLFSPNGDGNKDSLEISHTRATKEVEWKARIENSAGQTVKTYSWSNAVPGDVSWDGRSDDGTAAPAGEYRYVLEATDQAGNESGEILLEGIVLDRTETPIELLIEPRYISPNGDGVQDTATVYFDQSVKEGIIAWYWSVTNRRNEVMASGKEEGRVPEKITLNGDFGGLENLPEGVYKLSHAVEYFNGNRPSVEEFFEIDVTPPEISVYIENPIFSPDGDGVKETTEISFKSNEKVSWQGSIVDESGRDVLNTSSERTTSLIVWDGTTGDDEDTRPGTYKILAAFTDRAGNKTDITPRPIKIDIEPVEVKLAAAERGFSPNGDGKSDKLTFRIDSNQYEEVQRWTLNILNPSGEVQRVFSGEDVMPAEVAWDGNLNRTGEVESGQAPEGSYTAEIDVLYKKGARAGDRSDSFVLDVTPPRVGVKVAPDPFARTNGTIEGEVFITLNVEEENAISEWEMDLLDSKGEVIRTYTGGGDPSGDITWSPGKEDEGVKLETELFTLKLQVTDEAGNVRDYSQKVPLDVFLVKRDGKLYIAVPNIIFGAYQYALDSRGPEMEKRNLDSINRVYEIYRRYSDRKLLLEGHALNIYRGVNPKKEAEEEKVLVPLTENRAKTVKNALVERGMDPDRIEIQFFGGTRPIVSVHDLDVRWKNRRVEFIMKEK